MLRGLTRGTNCRAAQKNARKVKKLFFGQKAKFTPITAVLAPHFFDKTKKMTVYAGTAGEVTGRLPSQTLGNTCYALYQCDSRYHNTEE
jgi:hypothetical protein